MTESREAPQLYLIVTDGPTWDGERLAALLDAVQVACIRLETANRDEAEISAWVDDMREVAHARDVAILLAEHVELAARLGLDGVHLNGSRDVRDARKTLGKEAIVGSYCGASRHAGLTAGEIGANYISFGPVSETALGTGTVVESEVFAWWSEAIELPVVAEGGLSAEAIAALAGYVDFFALGPEVTSASDPVQALKNIAAELGA